MRPVTLYTKPGCAFSKKAKALLERKGVPYRELDVEHDLERRAQMRQASGRITTPQVFVGETHVGGFDELAHLDAAGRLDALLQAEERALET